MKGRVIMKNPIKKNMPRVPKRSRIAAAFLCAALLLPLLAGCTVTIKPRSGAESTGPDGAVLSEDGAFVFAGEGYSPEYLRTGLPEALRDVKITADKLSDGYAAPDTVFTVKTSSETGAAELKKHLNVSPSFAFEITEKNKTTFTVTPAEGLDSGMLYRFTVGDPSVPQSSFVFQTDSALIVKSVLPADLAVAVPLNTGIEVSFSEPLGKGINISDYFILSPETEGEYSVYPDGKTVVFVPKDPLEKNTVYTVGVKAGLPSFSGKTLTADFGSAFRTSGETAGDTGELMFTLESYEPQFTLSETPVIKYWYSAWDRTEDYSLRDAKVTIYRYASPAAVIEAMKEYEAVKADYFYGGETYVFPSDSLAEVGTYEITPETAEGNQARYNGYLTLPAAGEGAYLVNITFRSRTGSEDREFFCQAVMQISDLIVYTESSGENMLVWVNDASTGKTADGAAVKADFFNRDDYWNFAPAVKGEAPVYTAKNAVTGSDGLCFIETGGMNTAFMLVEKNGHGVYACVSSYSYANPESWFSHLFTDREIYFADDTVRFWGVIAPKSGGAALPEVLYLTLGVSKTRDKITVLPDGSFSGSFAVEGNAGWGIYMNFTDEAGNTVAAKYVGVTQQSKPVYRASLTFDKLFYTFGDTVNLTLSASFYDGTPAPGLEFTLYGNYFLENTVTLKTGPDGTASYSYRTAPYDFYTTYPVQLSAEAYLIGNEDVSLTAYGSAPYFQSKVWFRESRITPEDGGETYSEVYLNHFDTSVLKTPEDLLYPLYPENTLGKPAQGSVEVRLIRYEYIKEYDSTVYDPITKTSQIIYNYRQEQSDADKYTASFTDGVIRLDHIKPEEDFSGYYMYAVSYYDADNRCSYILNIYANAGDGQIYYYDNYEYYELKSDKTECSVGDTVTAVLHYGGKPVEDGRLLFTVYSDVLDLYSSTEKNSFSLIFEDRDAAGLAVLAAHFDGRRVQASGYLSLTYNYAENNLLNVTVSPDKTEYKPGEEAEVTVSVTDKNGVPVTGGLITLSMVDEACFALGEQDLNPLQDYYGGGSSPLPYISRDARFSCFVSYYGYYGRDMMYAGDQSAPMPAGAGMLNDGAKIEETAAGASAENVTVREIFEDNPLFETHAVSDGGKAVVKLTVPDNITEWRFTAVAAYHPDTAKISGMNMGTQKTGVICTLPFFTDVTLGDVYIEGDDIAGHARVYGSSLAGGDAVKYTFELKDSGGSRIDGMTLEARAGEFARFSFGRQVSGSYTVTVKAVSGVYSDGVSLPVEITSSGIMVNIRREIKPAEISALSPLMYPVSLTFTDSAYEDFFTLCRSLMRGTSRSDALAAWYAAALVSETISGTRNYTDKKLEEIKTTLSGYAGFIPLLPYSQGDIRLTAKICAVAPEALTSAKKTELAGLFADYIANRSYIDDADMCAAYLGLAALGEPVLGDLYYAAENSAGFTAEAKLYLAAALAYIGDYGAASAYYRSFMLKNSAAEETWLSVTASDTEESIKLTALALMTAAVVDTDGAALMADFLASHTSKVELYDLELASYVRYYFPAEAKTAAFSYSIGDISEEITLAPGEYYNLTLDRRDFTAFKLISADESVIVYAAYRGSAEEAYGSGEVTDDLRIQKTIETYDKARGLYKVVLSYRAVTDRNYAFFTLSDCIPSGARYFGAGGEYLDLNETDAYTFAYISNSGGQVMDGYIGLFNYSETALAGLKERVIEGSVSYLIRAAYEGTFVIENAVVQDIQTGSWTVSSRSAVEITGEGWIFG